MQHILTWGLIALGLLLLAVPATWEGRDLVAVSPGHALSLIDLVALVPLLAGVASLKHALWRERLRLMASPRALPMTFAAGLGAGLLIASAFNAFAGWWIVGAILLGAATIALYVAAHP